MNPIKIKITHNLLTPSASHDFEGVINNGEFIFAGNRFVTTSPIEWSITILNSGSDVLFVSGQATTTLSTECVRCLEPAEYEVEGEIEGYVALSTSAKLPKDVGEDELTPYEDDHSIDVAPLIEAAITLELPLQPLCSDDCPGIEYDHGQVSESSETHPFEVLKNYKF